MIRPHRQGCDAVDRQRDHFRQRIFCFTVQPRQAVIGDRRRLETKLDGEPAQEYMRFAVKGERAQSPLAHQAEIGMVRNDICAEPVENAIVEIRRAALEAAVCGAPLAHGKDNLGAAAEMVDHLCNDRHVVLQVGVERDHSIGFADLRKQPGQQRILMSDITRQFERADALRLRI